MTTIKQGDLVLDQKFDPRACRHTVNGWLAVLHCHHYVSLYSQLADDCSFFDAKTLLAEVAEDTFHGVLVDYYDQHCVKDVADRIAVAEQHYGALGLGKMRVVFAGPDSGEVELIHSHVDEGWIKKWGKRDRPVNFITCGYVAAMLSAVFGKATRAFRARETESIVMGAPVSRIQVVAC